MHVVRLGSANGRTDTQYFSVAADTDQPYQRVWWIEQAKTSAAVIRIVADIAVQLMFDLSGLIDTEPFIVYPGTNYIELELPKGVQLVGLQFAVWNAIGLRDGVNRHTPTYGVSFDADWAYLLYYHLLDLRNSGAANEAMLHFLRHLSSQIDATLRNDFSAHFFRISNGSEASTNLAYSDRHQRRLYQDLVGMTPTQFKRVVRFQQSLERMQAEQRLSWDGYYDQAHFSREIKQFTGLTPAQLFQHLI